IGDRSLRDVPDRVKLICRVIDECPGKQTLCSRACGIRALRDQYLGLAAQHDEQFLLDVAIWRMSPTTGAQNLCVRFHRLDRGRGTMKHWVRNPTIGTFVEAFSGVHVRSDRWCATRHGWRKRGAKRCLAGNHHTRGHLRREAEWPLDVPKGGNDDRLLG